MIDFVYKQITVIPDFHLQILIVYSNKYIRFLRIINTIETK